MLERDSDANTAQDQRNKHAEDRTAHDNVPLGTRDDRAKDLCQGGEYASLGQEARPMLVVHVLPLGIRLRQTIEIEFVWCGGRRTTGCASMSVGGCRGDRRFVVGATDEARGLGEILKRRGTPIGVRVIHRGLGLSVDR